jgi:carboxypeptidase C (cathepsin A)
MFEMIVKIIRSPSQCSISLANIMVKGSDRDMAWVNYMNRADVRDALHAKKAGVFAAWSNTLYDSFAMGMQDSYRTTHEYLLTKKIPVLIFSGLDDGKDTNFIGVHEFIEQLQWPGKKHYEHANTLPWSTPDDHEVVAYTKSGRLLTWAKVRKAGHMVPLDQPKVALLVEQYVKRPPNK